ncbi:RNA polymerase sigma factor [Luteimicrobium sp. DT211]|uniref:RNA polymerase sigma factor n=1 Tax=Luteimicrobium sp. DT211 TaxID=3393412 RepID=UPI003CF003FD
MPVREAVEAAHRSDWAAVVAATVRVTRDLDLAEECAQDAFTRALETWPRTGVPDRTRGWLVTVASNRARDLLRRRAAWHRALPLLVVDDVAPGPDALDEPPAVPDDTLRLVFTCCHPALGRDAQVALTLRLVCGLATPDVARAFLVREATMAARITRAKKKIAAAHIPYRVPSAAELPARVGAVCEVLHLVFTTGHTAPSGDRLVRAELVDAAVRQARTLHGLLPDERQVAGLLALFLLVDARRAAREDDDGRLVLLADQDRSLWRRDQVEEGTALLSRALGGPQPHRYAVEAAIAAVHAESPTWQDTDWDEIVGLYDVLLAGWPSPVVALNRAVAVGLRDGPRAGLAALEPLSGEPVLAGYGYLSAARADFLRRLGSWAAASAAYEEALVLTANGPERRFLEDRLRDVEGRLV